MVKRAIGDLTYRQKLFYLFNLLFILLLTVLLVVAFFFSRIWLNRMYHDQQENATVMSRTISRSFQDVESIPQAVMRNQHLLAVLEETGQQELALSDLSKLRSDLQEEINSIRYNVDNVKDVYLLNAAKENQTGFIYDQENLLNGFSLDHVLANTSQEDQQGTWYFGESLNSGLFVQRIYDVDNLRRELLGYLIVSVDLSFISQNQRNSGDLLYLRYQGDIYPQKTTVGDYLKTAKRPLSDQLQTIKGSSYLLTSFETSPFTFYYLVPNQQILKNLFQLLFVLIIWVMVILVAIFATVQYNLNRLVKPIQDLAKIMGEFKGEDDLKKMAAIAATYPEITSKDEVGILYTSFRQLMDSLDQLVVKNYQSRLLGQQMELKSLQSQLDPHFLYNTLDSINWLALSKGEEEISEMVNALAFLFRKKLADPQTIETVTAELEVVDAYVYIQQVRFGPRLDFQKEVSEDSLAVRIPHLLIQPIIENAMKYALGEMDGVCHIRLAIFQSQGQLVIKVTDNGPGFQEQETPKGTGIGLKNIRQRLELLYGEKGKLTVFSAPYEETTVTVSIPLEGSDLQYE